MFLTPNRTSRQQTRNYRDDPRDRLEIPASGHRPLGSDELGEPRGSLLTRIVT
jgi:hypothetical protein